MTVGSVYMLWRERRKERVYDGRCWRWLEVRDVTAGVIDAALWPPRVNKQALSRVVAVWKERVRAGVEAERACWRVCECGGGEERKR